MILFYFIFYRERRSSYKLLLSDAQKDFPSFEEAKQRNKSLLKDLETVKGNLRSKAIFSPAEMEWENICKRYQDEPSLPVKTWKCNIPIFV